MSSALKVSEECSEIISTLPSLPILPPTCCVSALQTEAVRVKSIRKALGLSDDTRNVKEFLKQRQAAAEARSSKGRSSKGKSGKVKGAQSAAAAKIPAQRPDLVALSLVRGKTVGCDPHSVW